MEKGTGASAEARERVHRPPALVLPAICVPGDVDDRDSPPAKISVVRCPLICEQGPSAPSSPTSPDPRLKRPRPLTVDAMQRINLLSTSYDFGKLSPVSPNYATSDLGSSPRSSISVTSAHLGPWTAFRDQHKSSFDLDDGSSDVCSKDLLSPGMMLSPAPYSPFSDTDRPETPFSSFGRSPNLSPHVSTKSLNHFSFDLRSSSSMSNRHHHHHHHHDHQLHLLVPGGSLDQLARERSRSDSDMTPSNDQMDTSVHSTISVPAASSSSSSSYKKLLMKKYHDDNQESRMKLMKPRSSSTPPPSATESEIDDYDLRSVSRQTSRQATIDDNHAHGDENRLLHLEGANLLAAFDETRKIEDWMKQQLAAFQAANTLYNHVVSSLIVGQQVTPATTLALSAVTPISVPQIPMAVSKQENEPMPIVQPPNQQGAQSSHQPQQHQFVCTTCGQAFAVHDRLAKHIASRHRERSATLDDASKVHRCTICAKSFGRSDMLTRHMRLHTGAKPYNCQTCGQVFSRSDHLSTHLRTHTGEKPYACPLCSYSASRRDMISRHMRTHSSSDGLPIDISAPIAQLSLRSASASPLPPHNTSQASLTSASSSHDVRQLLSVLGGSLDLKLTEEVRIGSGEKSAFRPTGATSNFLAVPLTTHSLSTPSSPTPGVRSPLLSAPLSRQSSFGLYDDQPNPC